jgi:hypothetical protein
MFLGLYNWLLTSAVFVENYVEKISRQFYPMSGPFALIRC